MKKAKSQNLTQLTDTTLSEKQILTQSGKKDRRGRPKRKPGDPPITHPAKAIADRELRELLDQETDKKTGLIKETGQDEETVARRLSRGPGMAAAVTGFTVETTEPGKLSVSDLIRKNLTIAKLPDIDMMDAEQVERRVQEYFAIEEAYGNRPTVAGLAMSLNGMDRRRLWEIVTGNFGDTRGMTTHLPKSVTDCLKKYYAILAQLWEDYMQSGKINPVSGIFLGKNNYGYKDQVEHVVTPNVTPDFDEQQIRERLSLTDSDTDSDSD